MKIHKLATEKALYGGNRSLVGQPVSETTILNTALVFHILKATVDGATRQHKTSVFKIWLKLVFYSVENTELTVMRHQDSTAYISSGPRQLCRIS